MSGVCAPEEASDGRESLNAASRDRQTGLERFCRRIVLRQLSRLARGHVLLDEGDRTHRFGNLGTDELQAVIRVHRPGFWTRLVLGGTLEGAESYIRADWDCDDLASLLRILSRNAEALAAMDRGVARLLNPLRRVAHWLRRNTRAGSRRNISAHYDLSNDFFAQMLDPSMAYSCGIFASPSSTLADASREKFERICLKLELSPSDHLLEIGSGWGGLAIHAAGRFGCRVTATTISLQQYNFAQRRIREAQLADRITLLLQDYRDVQGCFDKLVSVEMIEAVGEQYLDTFFRKCSRVLSPRGMMLLQAITIPDHRKDQYRKSVDFIQQYVFPGGSLPCFSSMGRSLRRVTDLRWFHSAEMGTHYAQTLAHWRHNFWSHIARVRELGFDERFVRTWHYYLCYCEAAFREREIGVSQILLTKPGCRRADLLCEILSPPSATSCLKRICRCARMDVEIRPTGCARRARV